jgi:hypothetical protein
MTESVQHIFVGMSTETLKRLKFGHGLRRDGLTAVSARILPIPPGGPPIVERAHFVSCSGSVACTGKAAMPLPLLCHHQWCRPFDHRRFQLYAPP